MKNQLYDKGNDEVECKDFPGLEQALKNTAWGKIPGYLEPIAIQIEKDGGKITDIFHIPTQILVCTVIKEMEDFSVGDLDWGTLKKWGATLNCAKKHGFQVGFADNLLKQKLLYYFHLQILPKSKGKWLCCWLAAISTILLPLMCLSFETLDFYVYFSVSVKFMAFEINATFVKLEN